MLLLNASRTATGAAALVRKSFSSNLLARNLASVTTDEVPQRFHKMFQEVALNMNVKNYENIKLIRAPKIVYYAGGINYLPGGRVIGIPEYYCSRDLAKKAMIDFIHSSNTALPKDDVSDMKLIFGLSVSENVIKYCIAHELAHHKMNDIFWMESARVGWLTMTASLTVCLFQFLPELKISSLTEVIPNSDDLIVSFGIPIASLWLVCFFLYKKCTNYWDVKLEHRADLLAGQVSLEMALGGIRYHKALMTYAKHLGLDKKKTTTHANGLLRIKLLEEIEKEHNTKHDNS